MISGRLVVVAALGLMAAVVAEAADWPQWRGPDRNGVAPQSPPLVTTFPAGGPTKAWTSADLPGGDRGGYGSVAVAGGKVYVYSYAATPVKWRMVTKQKLAASGYDADMPADLSKAVEEARVSDARKPLKDKELNVWVNNWLKENVKADQAKFKEIARARLNAGANAVPLETLAKLATILDKKFDTEPDFAAWLKENGVTEDAALKLVLQRFGPGESEKDIDEALYRLDAATGKIDWKTPFDGTFFWYAVSPTPTVVDGKVYVSTSRAKITCLDAAKGDKLWESEALAPASFTHNRSTSVLVVDGVAVGIYETGTAGVDIKDGKKLWFDKNIRNQQSSATVWRNANKNFVVINGIDKLWCLEPQDGKVVWSVAPCGGAGTPAIAGDTCVVVGVAQKEKNEQGKDVEVSYVGAYKMSADKAELIWKTKNADTHSGAMISGDYVYVVGNAYQESGKGKAMCLSLKDGSIVWEEKVGQAQLSTPLMADGKILAVNGGEFLMFNADPAKFTLIGKANLGLVNWSSPAIADGKAYLRTGKNVVCLDLTKQ